MFDALLNGRIDTGGLHFDVEYRDIEALNRGVQAGEADVSKISCAVLPAVADGYALLDSGAALGRGNGPLLVRRAGDRSPIRRVAVPGVHTTANALMMRLFPRITERTPADAGSYRTLRRYGNHGAHERGRALLHRACGDGA